ncbi:MAG: prkC 29 [Planctomycetota bacterium]|nr:prkC 29 [Planctomycetota bacterium]
MPVKVLCPNPDCSASYSVSEAQVGRAARCKKCGTKFTLSGDSSLSGSSPSGESGEEAAGAIDLPNPFGPYEIHRKLGQGGMGAVYLAHDPRLDRPVALKLPHVSTGDGPEVLDRFQREARAAAGFRHPNFCPIYDVGQIEGRHYLAMAYVEGKTLAEYVDRDEPMPPREAAETVRRIAVAMSEAHKKGILHRDLKPANVMVDERGDLILMDFGLARRVDSDDPGLTASGAMLGTPHYMSPEQVRGDRSAMGPTADVYSLGVILYELMTGRRPFEGPMSLVLGLIAISDPAPPSEFQPGLDPALEAICLKAMARAIPGRYPSMQAFATALGNYLDRPIAEPGRRRPAVAATPVDLWAMSQDKVEEPGSAEMGLNLSQLPPRQGQLIGPRRRNNPFLATGSWVLIPLVLGAIAIYAYTSRPTTTKVQDLTLARAGETQPEPEKATASEPPNAKIGDLPAPVAPKNEKAMASEPSKEKGGDVPSRPESIAQPQERDEVEKAPPPAMSKSKGQDDLAKATPAKTTNGAPPGGAGAAPAKSKVSGRTLSRRELILRTLDKPIDMPFANETPLEEVLKYVMAATSGPGLEDGIPFFIDPVALQEVEKTVSSPVTIRNKGIPLKVSLKIFLGQLDLGYSLDKTGSLLIIGRKKYR